jgi:gentisate 1,2-dioxygenase
MSAVLEGTRIPDLDALYRRADALDVTPGWIKREQPLLWPEPKSAFVPTRWRYDEIKQALDAAGGLIDVALAERRNLVLRNPFPGNTFATARTLACAYQMILPGEKAPSHRHSSHALRVILEAAGAYSIVDGEKTPMETGDVVLTPGWFWHGHGHDGDKPAYWFDGLDVPLTHLLEPMFYEEHPQKYETVTSSVTASKFRFTGAAISRQLDAARPHPDGLHGPRITLDAPDMPSLLLTMERLASGAGTRKHRSTANQVFVVVDGSGETEAGGTRLAWQRGDTFVIPTWTSFRHRAAADAQLFCLSDEPLLRFSHYYRVEAL